MTDDPYADLPISILREACRQWSLPQDRPKAELVAALRAKDGLLAAVERIRALPSVQWAHICDFGDTITIAAAVDYDDSVSGFLALCPASKALYDNVAEMLREHGFTYHDGDIRSVHGCEAVEVWIFAF